ncbi:tripartite tricarboxylate transporter substrate binding protein [Bordetella hinzii]|uniref:Tripartite tricarboxylate transporter family receptor n=1 Tax=Bordetella hinzii OH87 BAL007II TaxID=1331262 RepID=A0ABR4QY46_9BORD|nr:tripartite tricarboxylate transporter substrate binding protein [Bordetella hinzii]KCB22527.1 tripartite tricarboxylate transporter family receptor [Bordetella hinzii OH87 BAL007II]KCB29160.1 tripartite tricarboxylate transporter family receptor [Bordetella hinzii CA90 BAL1384]KCB41701.1 tripartite tricarboxylate transporter family receptor [Bordetella hinzii 5132]QDJ40928.1 tripartite tricarboxylate transporter substrate binding protein [Bordetella hinzii]QDJ45488.1 tripartite tricarboxyla
MKKRNGIAGVLIAMGLALGAGAALAAGYPDKPVTLVVPYPPGGATDVIARLIAEKLPAAWGQQVIINNRPGAGTTVAAEAVARSPGDGYTLYMTTAAHTISASLYKKLNYDPLKDFAPLTLTSTIPLVLVTAPSLPVKNLDELIAYAKAAPDGLSMASTGNGTPQHLTGELFKAKAGIKLVHVPYRGDAPMLTDLIGGQVQMAFVTLSAALPHIQSGKLNAIALAHPRRVDAIAKVPTMAEAGMKDFEAATWFGLFAPSSMPDDLRQNIYQDVSKVVATPEMTRKLQDMGGEVNNSSPQQFQAFINEEARRWAEGVKLSGAQID